MEAGAQIQQIFRDVLAIEVPSTDTDVIETGLLDSLGLVMLLFEIEQQFGITVPLDDLDLERLRTIRRMVEFVESLPAA